MEVRFRAVTQHNEDAYRAMVSAHYRLFSKINIKWLYAIITVVTLIAGAVYIKVPGSLLLALALRATLLIVTLLLAKPLDKLGDKRVVKMLTKKAVSNARDANIIVECDFFDDKLMVKDKFGSGEILYPLFTTLVETEKYFLLFAGKSAVYIVGKTSIERGSCADFAAFIAAVCGREIVQMHI